MTPERWQQMTAVFHAALERGADDRAAFVAAQCGDDAALRQEVEAMLAGHHMPGPLSRAPHTLAGSVLAAGTRLGPYEVVSLLGCGGMGEVYRASDTKLHRDVALKVLLPSVAADPDRLARFANEARLLAALNHPHIAQVHGLEELASSGPGQPSISALVMELVEGPTLAELLAAQGLKRNASGLTVRDTLAIASQIAEALEAAHDRGIVHRDLKPANIKVRPDGTAKVLDFGLAKTLDAHIVSTDATSVQIAAGNTEPGMIVGTAAYMSPEQAKGQPVDRRADLWAFGCVLFEMLTGTRAFDDGSLPEVLLKILGEEPRWDALPSSTPASIHALLHRCLEKDPKRRLDSAAVARVDIDDAIAADTNRLAGHTTGANERVLSTDAPLSSRAHRHMRARRIWAGVAALAVAVALGLARGRDRSTTTDVPRLQNAQLVTNALGVENSPTWSPDGTRIAYHASDGGYVDERDHDIFVSQLGRSDPINLTNGERDNRNPSWSPDGREIAFFSNRSGTWGVYVMPAIGGRPHQVLPTPDMNASNWSAPQWSSDGRQLHVSLSQQAKNVVLVLSLSSLQTTRVELPDHDGTVVWDLSLSPDGRRYAYVSGSGGEGEVTQLWTIAASGGGPIPLTDGNTNVWSPTWSKNGRNVYYVSNRGGAMDLWQQTVQSDGKPVGAPVAITQGLGIRSAAFSSDAKRLAYSRGAWVSNVWRVPILDDRPATWNDAKALTSEHSFVEFVDVSPDGKQLAFSSDRRGNQDLWLMPSDGGEVTPLTSDPSPDWNPRWSPDGRQIAFYSNRSGNRDIWVMPSSGGPARQLSSNPRRESEPTWSPDGRDILFRSRGPLAAWIVSAAGGEPRLLAEGFGAGPEWSPDGTWVLLRRRDRLYRVPRAGGSPILLPFAPPHARFQTPRFSSDGQSLYYSVASGPKAGQNIWKLSVTDGKVSPLTQLEGRRGNLSYYFAFDARSLYFTWNEDDGDIWVMDVADTGTAK